MIIPNSVTSDGPMRSEERLAGERGELLDRGKMQEMDLQTKEGLQVLQEMNREKKRPKGSPVMHTAATRGVLEYISNSIIVSNCTIVS